MHDGVIVFPANIAIRAERMAPIHATTYFHHWK
jgi:hypothetical protein